MCMSMICGYNTESEDGDSDSEPCSKRTHKDTINFVLVSTCTYVLLLSVFPFL